MAEIHLGFDLRSSANGASHADMVEALLDMCEWADKKENIGSFVRVLEHHGSPDGYIPSPVTLASAIAGRTRKMKIGTVVILPLYNPLRLAEDLAILDLVSRGRVSTILAAGYRKAEYDMLGYNLSERGKLMEKNIEVLKQAWTGEPFDYEGRTVQVTPRPFQRPRPPILMGGASKPAARRAARIADGFIPVSFEVMKAYREELVALGKDPGPEPVGTGMGPTVVAVSEDPEATWKIVGEHCLHEMNVYVEWQKASDGLVQGFFETDSVDELRAANRYVVQTPQQCLETAKASGGIVSIQPMLGGISPEVAWKSLKLIEAQVLPKL
jgi:alkanesulfonate monooxygenase SsuD/methylene tetrahydromethanopterin reductase-like flavin-dependent oxidoreductase (luciferase family)